MDKHKALQIIWNYLNYDSVLDKADCIVVFGSHDLNVARRGAQLYLEGYAPVILFTGGVGKGTLGKWDLPESEIFAKIATDMGVPKEDIYTESKSTNTGENIRFSKKVLKENSIKVKNIIGVQKPYMGRRLYASIAKQWEDVNVLIASPEIPMNKYLDGTYNIGVTNDELIHIVVGDFIRIETYAKLGFQIEQMISDEAWEAYYYLRNIGFTKYLT